MEISEKTPLRGQAEDVQRRLTGLMGAVDVFSFFRFKHLHLVCLVTYAGALLLSTVCFSYWIESWPVVDSLYFGVVSMTTVGYGDIAPESVEGRVAAMALTLLGIAMVLGILNKAIEQHFSRRRWWDDLAVFVPVALVLATWMIARFEGWDLFTSIYFFVVTGTTLGYGDVSPQTPAMKAFCVLYIPALVMSFALFITNKLTDFCTEHLDKDAIIKEWIDNRGLTLEGMEQLDFSKDDRVDYAEFLLGMVKYFLDAYGKIPDKVLVQQLKEKFLDLACNNKEYICKEDIEKYQQRLKEKKDAEDKDIEIDVDHFFEILLMHFDKIPERDRNVKNIHELMRGMFEERSRSRGRTMAYGGDEEPLKEELRMTYRVGDDGPMMEELIRLLSRSRALWE